MDDSVSQMIPEVPHPPLPLLNVIIHQDLGSGAGGVTAVLGGCIPQRLVGRYAAAVRVQGLGFRVGIWGFGCLLQVQGEQISQIRLQLHIIYG